MQCFLWSTLPSSAVLSDGRFVSQIYEGKHRVDAYIRELGLPAVFLLTGNFYENYVKRKHITYDAERDVVTFTQPIIRPTTKLAMLYVERDLATIAKGVWDAWDTRKDSLVHQHLYCSDGRRSAQEVLEVIGKVTGKRTEYVCEETTGWPDRDIMFKLYNERGMYGKKEIPDENVLALGVELEGLEGFVREKLVPHLGLG